MESYVIPVLEKVHPDGPCAGKVLEVFADLGVAVDAGQGAELSVHAAPGLAGLLKAQGGTTDAAKHMEYFELVIRHL